MVEPVAASIRLTSPGDSSRRAKKRDTQSLLAIARMSGVTAGCLNPDSGSSAPFKLMISAGWSLPSRQARQRIAAPAECPTTSVGETPIALSSSTSPSTMPRSDKPMSSRGREVKPCPGRSGAMTRKNGVNRGKRSRKECVDAPVPCTSKQTGPDPASCTCQRSPAASTKRLYALLGQSAPSRSQSGARKLLTRSPAEVRCAA